MKISFPPRVPGMSEAKYIVNPSLESAGCPVVYSSVANESASGVPQVAFAYTERYRRHIPSLPLIFAQRVKYITLFLASQTAEPSEEVEFTGGGTATGVLHLPLLSMAAVNKSKNFSPYQPSLAEPVASILEEVKNIPFGALETDGVNSKYLVFNAPTFSTTARVGLSFQP